MATSNVIIPVPASGFGSAVDVSALVGEKTVILSGRYQGAYVLYGTHDGSHFAPLLIFNAGGIESIRQTFSGALQAVRLKSLASDAAGVNASISGLSVPLDNSFSFIGPVGKGFSGVMDLGNSAYQTDLNFMGFGRLSGSVVVEGSSDGLNFNPIGSFSASGVNLFDVEGVIEFSPLETVDKVRYVRLNVLGDVPDLFMVTIGGAQSDASGGAETLRDAYLAGVSSVDQTMPLSDANGGAIIIDASSAGLTGNLAFEVLGNLSGDNAFEVFKDGSLEVGGLGVGIVIGEPKFPASAPNAGCVAIGYLALIPPNYDPRAIAIGMQSVSSGQYSIAIGGSTYSYPFGVTRATGNSSVAIGPAAQANNDSTIAMGVAANALGIHAVAVGPFCTASSDSCLVFGNGSTATWQGDIVIGTNSITNGLFGSRLVIGNNSLADFGDNVVAIGEGVQGLGTNSVVIGAASQSGAAHGVAIGSQVLASFTGDVVIGSSSATSSSVSLTPENNVVIGAGSSAVDESSVVVGTGSSSLASFSVVVGAGSHADGLFGVAVGYNALSQSDDGIAIGALSTSASYGVAVGSNSSAEFASVAVGEANVLGEFSVGIGEGAKVGSGMANVAIGYISTINGSGAANTCVGFAAMVGDPVSETRNFHNNVRVGGGNAVYANFSIGIGGNVVLGSTFDPTPIEQSIAIGEWATATGSYAMAFGYSAIAGEHEATFGDNVSNLGYISRFHALSNVAVNNFGTFTSAADSIFEPGVATTLTSPTPLPANLRNRQAVTIAGSAHYDGAWFVSNIDLVGNTFDISTPFVGNDSGNWSNVTSADLFGFDAALLTGADTTVMTLLIEKHSLGVIEAVPVTLSAPAGGFSYLQVANS